MTHDRAPHPGLSALLRLPDAGTPLADEIYRRNVIEPIPAGFIGEPCDCAGLALLLCFEAGRYIAGQDRYVDGGTALPQLDVSTDRKRALRILPVIGIG